MALLVPDVGEAEMLARILGKNGSPAGLSLQLFENDKTPGESDVHGDYTAPNDGSYGAQALTGASWTIATDAGVTEASYAQQTFTFAGEGSAQSIYGYFVTSTTAGSATVLLWAERFTDGPYTIPTGGGTIRITPKVRLD